MQNEKLNTLFQEYLDDFASRAKDEITIRNREKEVPELQNLMHRFIEKEIDLNQLRDDLQSLINRDDDPWFFKGFMIELRKLRKNHDEHHPYAEDELRSLLTGLTSVNLGKRIEQFYDFLKIEQTRLRHEGKTSQQAMWPANAGVVLTIFYTWLNPGDSPVFYYPSTLRAVFRLIQEQRLYAPAAAKWAKEFFIHTEQSHLDYQTAIVELSNSISVLKANPFATELFLNWYDTQTYPKQAESARLIKEFVLNGYDAKIYPKRAESAQLIKEVDDTTLLSRNADDTLKVAEGNPSYTTSPEPLIPNDPLPAIPEEPLQERIQEVQKYILLDEKIIRDIYHALLAGHVILTGPPGTGKTELARLIPEILWGGEQFSDSEESSDSQDHPASGTQTAYTTRLVTATDEWSVRTLIGGIAPSSNNGSVAYSIQYGYLTTTILNNWAFNSSRPDEWETLKRTPIQSQSVVNPGQKQEFHGRWLVIDEFNRAPIDLALGEALTALGGSGFLRVPIEGGSAELPIPPDFRIIGTLNSFDRNYLNQISEALKRRFSFVEILPPARNMRVDEQAIALYKALKSISHLSETLSIENDTQLDWHGVLSIEHDPEGFYAITWENEDSIQRSTMRACWQLFEVIRIYRQLGTAQAITLMRHMLINGILQNHETAEEGWSLALDEALCNTVADQLQVLLPDEIEALYLYLKLPHAEFAKAYNQLLANLADTPRRLRGQLASLNTIMNEAGKPYLSDELLEQIEKQDQPQVPETVLNGLFHLDQSHPALPRFTRRLRAFKQERGL